MYLFISLCHASWPNEKRYRPEIWHTFSHWPYLKTDFFCFFKKITVTAASLKKLPCHVDFSVYLLDRLVLFYFNFIIFHSGKYESNQESQINEAIFIKSQVPSLNKKLFNKGSLYNIIYSTILYTVIYRVGKDLSPHLRKSSHIASKYNQCRTSVPIFWDLS